VVLEGPQGQQPILCFSADAVRSSSSLYERPNSIAKLTGLSINPRARHDAFEQFGAFNQDAIDAAADWNSWHPRPQAKRCGRLHAQTESYNQTGDQPSGRRMAFFEGSWPEKEDNRVRTSVQLPLPSSLVRQTDHRKDSGAVVSRASLAACPPSVDFICHVHFGARDNSQALGVGFSAGRSLE
jgi:hypothetical protein